MTNLPDDVVELFERHMKAPYRERLESCPYSFERSETGQMYRVATIEDAYRLFAAGYAARAALEAARYGELVGLLREADSVAWPEVAIMLTHERPRSVVAKERFLEWRDKARALLSSIGEPNPDSGGV